MFSTVKYVELQKKLKKQRLIDARRSLPVLNREQILGHRLPFHAALIRKMETNGFRNSAEYLRQLVNFQDAQRNAAGEDTIIWLRPQLMYQEEIFEHLARGLVKAEAAHFDDELYAEIDEILQLAREYCFGDENWWWIGHQLLFLALDISESYDEDRGKRKALVRYVFGKFLFENVKDLALALEHLTVSRILSNEMSWNINLVFKNENDLLFAEVCVLINKVLLIQAKNLKFKDPEKAIKLCDKARFRALEGCFHQGAIEALLVKGSCQMIMYNSANAIQSYLRALKTLEQYLDVDLNCQALRNLAIAYIKHGVLHGALVTLQKLQKFARNHNKLLYVAEAHKYLGEYYLKEGTATNATPLLLESVKLFDEEGNFAETVKARTLAAISIGVEMMPMFCDFVRNGDSHFSNNYKELIDKLLQWKDFRNDIWQISNEQTTVSHALRTLRAFSKEQYETRDQSGFDVEELIKVTKYGGE